jgi:hypothetical protein
MKRILFLALFLSACSTQPQIVTTTKHSVVMPPVEMFECPTVDTFPESATLSDLEVASLLTRLFQYNQECKYSIESIRTFLEKSKADTEAPAEP